MAKKRTIRQIPHLPDENHKELWYELEYSDGSRDFVDKDGKSLNAVAITDEQLEAWKKMPRDEASKEIFALIKNNSLDVSEKRFILDAIWKLAELHGATQPQYQSQNIVAIQIHVADLPPGIKVMNTHSQSIESEDKR